MLHETELVRELLNKYTSGTRAYIILDCAQIQEFDYISLIDKCNCKYKFLLSSNYYNSAKKYGPILVELNDNLSFLKWYTKDCVNNFTGLAITCNSNFEDIFDHLKSWIEVILPNYNIAIFRYYDPVVFKKIMETMSRQDIFSFFGSIDAFYCPVRHEKRVFWNKYSTSSIYEG